jgi:hypothetical protein
MKNNQKTTPEQREEIIRVYQESPAASKELCLSLGLSARYGHQIASIAGKAHGKKLKRFTVTEAEKARIRKIVHIDDSHDHRWQWAVERGPVVAP